MHGALVVGVQADEGRPLRGHGPDRGAGRGCGQERLCPPLA
ncbi:hypothetical protein [Deinococcus multiflagellatus]|uniref:Uncharacterized protein n=1 Tax=Deinococcus multiflagellatus TaxID=1656887 RepID=A0ABW1ZFW2_9DEIO